MYTHGEFRDKLTSLEHPEYNRQMSAAFVTERIEIPD